MVDPNDPHWLEFRAYAQEALMDIVENLESQGVGTEEAIETAAGLLQSQLFAPQNAHLSYRNGDELPLFNEFGWLPATHMCSIEEFVRRFGKSSDRREDLSHHILRIVKLAGNSGGERLIVGGSFVTAENEPNDVDAALLLSAAFFDRLKVGNDSNVNTLWELSGTQSDEFPIDLFLERDEASWWSWFRFFSESRDPVHLYRGVVEIRL